MGGFYERLIGLLRKAIGKVRLTNDQLLAVLKEAEAVVNSRPLVYVSEDIHSHITLTPAHFLTLNPKIGIPDNDLDNDVDYNPDKSAAGKKLLETWKKGHKLLDRFWQIWRNDYLLSLRKRTILSHKWWRGTDRRRVTKGKLETRADTRTGTKWRRRNSLSQSFITNE